MPKSKRSPSKQELKVEVKGGRLVISIGIDTLAFAAENMDSNLSYDDDWKPTKGFTVSNKKEFAEDVLRELEREEEDGTTPVHILLDSACEEAVNQGSLGVELHDDGKKEQG